MFYQIYGILQTQFAIFEYRNLEIHSQALFFNPLCKYYLLKMALFCGPLSLLLPQAALSASGKTTAMSGFDGCVAR